MTDPTLVEELERKQAERAAVDRDNKQPVSKYLSKSEWSADDHFTYIKTGNEPLNPEWSKARDKALAAAGLEPDDSGPKDPAEMTPAEHFEHIRRTDRNA